MKTIAILAGLVVLAAGCARVEPAGAESTAPSESAGEAGDGGAPSMRLYTLDCGRIEMLDLGVFDVGGAYDGRRNSAVDTCFLIRHPKGDLLWDAGLPDSLHEVEGGVTNGPFALSMPKTLDGQLPGLGLAPGDIEYFSISHSHFDHVGNAGVFANATFIVHEDERAHMFRDEARADAQTFPLYSALENAQTITFTDEYDVFGDGSVRIIAAPGHTPGHSVLLVTLENTGPALLSGDLYHLSEARERRTVPRFNTDAEETLRSMDKFEAIAAETGAMVVIQHEAADFERLPQPPAYLD
ncbi:N-acyl homoserine lactonase family protein [Amphiplicatus metriothermophilus]|uniref:Metallo-beta-lactamase superfamily protein n=1 Tax=Amphiplicatus metriothermophilus TaxID=1519374 RepID=A0A239PPI4_9PROT|nr:N-acyl homoserine lactonase family protein [Amphiplicatus metriothermophilus]MBB5518785.1 glyoxylase-like metal-dependent hydrolase (beta-lactamase superfamily II) [Amphiplicatus metriothermophilus]SNT72060.1 Metallo-beta-lactamase superfamily protein [Amphiplicatus metriothermophilus]